MSKTERVRDEDCEKVRANVKMRKLLAVVVLFAGIAAMCAGATSRPVPRPALAARLAAGPEIYGIVHWGLNTYTDREWGFGNEDPVMLNPGQFDADRRLGLSREVADLPEARDAVVDFLRRRAHPFLVRRDEHVELFL